MQSLYEWDIRGTEEPDKIVTRNVEAYEDDADPDYVKKIVSGVVHHVETIDQSISEVAPEWPVDQIAAIDKAILRLAVFELLFDDEVPPKVAINEAVELGKTFGSDSTSRFVNGVLGTLYRQSSRYNPEDDKASHADQAADEPKESSE